MGARGTLLNAVTNAEQLRLDIESEEELRLLACKSSSNFETFGPSLFLSVMLDVHLRCFSRMMHRVVSVPVSGMGVVRRLFVSARMIMFCGLLVVSGCVLMVLGRSPVVFCCFFGHRCLLADLNVVKRFQKFAWVY